MNLLNILVITTSVLLTLIHPLRKTIKGVPGVHGVLTYNCSSDFDHKTVPIHYFIPDGDKTQMKVQIVMHGASRNADEYLKGWAESSKAYNLIIIAPEFSKEQFSIGTYTQGNLLDSLKQVNDKRKTLFYLLDELFLFTKDQLKLEQDGYYLFGHSAGGQFVHRFLQFHDSPYVKSSVAANPGWYTYPDENIKYPYGIQDLFSDPQNIKREYFSKDMTILLGTADTLRSSNLRMNADADLQGLNRLERGKNYYEHLKKVAQSHNIPFNWKLSFVQDAGHDHTLMSPAAADALFGKQ
jgi:hypothetical protein